MISQNLFTVAVGSLAILATIFVQPALGWVVCNVHDCGICLNNPASCGCWNIDHVRAKCICNIHDCGICLNDPASCGCWNIDDVRAQCIGPGPTQPPGVNGDPHFKTWSGEKYDFHGVCDLVLLTSHEVNIHIRTKKTRAWSYIHSVSVQIDNDILEVVGGADENRFWINKVRGESTSNIQLSNYGVDFTQLSAKSRQFVIDMGESKGKITIRTWNAMVSVSFTQGSLFEQSRGLMGTYPDGRKVSRSSDTIMDNNNAFGMEWQVQRSEPQLFNTPSDVVGKCETPSKTDMRRQLAEAVISKEEAEIACIRVNKEDFDLCVFDVMATNDKASAGAY